MNPNEAFERAIEFAFLSSRAFRPGEVVGHLPKDVRAALERLTSDHALNHRAEFLDATPDPIEAAKAYARRHAPPRPQEQP